MHVLGALPHRHRRDNVRIVHVAEEPVRDLAVCSPRAPFILWAAMALLGLAALGFLRRDKPEARPVG